MTVAVVDVVLVFTVVGGGRFRRRFLMILRSKMIITTTKMIMITGIATPIPIDTGIDAA